MLGRFAKSTIGSRRPLALAILRNEQAKLKPTNQEDKTVVVNGKVLTKREIEFGVEPKHANTPHLYQPFLLPMDAKETLPLWYRLQGVWGWGLVIAPICKLFKLAFMNMQYYGEHQQLKRAVATNPRERKHKIFTICNHVSNIDDPLLTSVTYSYPKCYLNSVHLPWAIAGHNILFVTKFQNWFFQHGRAVPGMRGQGVYQIGHQFLSRRLRYERGFFHHVYAEGKVNMFNEKLDLKWGVAKLLQEEATIASEKQTAGTAYTAPTIRVIWHLGLNNVMSPFRNDDARFPYFPDTSKNILKGNRHKVTVNVGRALDFNLLLSTMRTRRKKCPDLVDFKPRSLHDYADLALCEERQAVMDLVDVEMDRMKAETEKIHAERARLSGDSSGNPQFFK